MASDDGPLVVGGTSVCSCELPEEPGDADVLGAGRAGVVLSLSRELGSLWGSAFWASFPLTPEPSSLVCVKVPLVEGLPCRY